MQNNTFLSSNTVLSIKHAGLMERRGEKRGAERSGAERSAQRHLTGFVMKGPVCALAGVAEPQSGAITPGV